MNTLKIKEIRLHNFKGFEKLTLTFQDSLISILGGKNGFGKTTIFDAIELVLTGVILRYDVYTNYHNKTKSFNEECKPLVYSNEVAEVKVEIVFQCGNKEITVLRKAETSSLKNPICFQPFEKLYIKEDEKERLYTEEDELGYHVKSFGEGYTFLNYISQEDATSYLKSKDADRSNMIQQLFRTNDIDERIQKAKKASTIYKRHKIDYESGCKRIKEEIQALTKSVNTEVESINYIKLSTKKKWDWDAENPELSFERYSELLQKDGILDEISYLINNKVSFNQYRKNEWLDKNSTQEVLASLYYFLAYKRDDISAYKKYINVQGLINKLTFGNFSLDFFPKVRAELHNIISEENLNDLQNQNDYLLSILNGANKMEAIVNILIQQRNDLAKTVESNNDSLELDMCPLCGYNYKQPKLQEAIAQHMPAFVEGFKDIKQNASHHFDLFKQALLSKIISPLSAQFESLHINEIVQKKYDSLDEPRMQGLYKVFVEKLLLNIDLSEGITVADFVLNLRTELVALKQEIDISLNYQQMSRTFDSYMVYLEEDMWDNEIVDQKRQYLTQHWNSKQSELRIKKEKELALFNDLVSECKEKEKRFKSITEKLTAKRTDYIKKLVSDIEILFYIYSGRIMQDSTFGRGLFLKYDAKRVLFVSNPRHDVDALYHLSSGQLVAVIYAFTLALNKLYSRYRFIAIDDPVQTIDDINIWGLVETLRHEFYNSCILLSTHETDYGSFLRYKFSKWGIPTKYIDMGKERKTANS